MRVLLADDHSIVRRGLRGLLEAAGLTVVAEPPQHRRDRALCGAKGPNRVNHRGPRERGAILACGICGGFPPEHDGLGSGSAIYSNTSFDRQRVRRAVSMMSWRKSVLVGIAALTWGTRPFASTHEIHRGQLKSQRQATAVPSAAIQPDIDRTAKVSPLGIAKVRLDPPPPGVKENSAVLKFQMSNVSSSPLTDIVFEVSIVEEPQQAHFDTARQVLAGPFTIRGKVVLGPGYTADYEILLRNISRTCKCAANVRVLSFRLIGDSGP